MKHCLRERRCGSTTGFWRQKRMVEPYHRKGHRMRQILDRYLVCSRAHDWPETIGERIGLE